MKLKVFDSSLQGPTARSTKPYFTINRRGMVTINKYACRLMGLKNGDRVVIGQDIDSPNDWYVFKRDDGCRIRVNKSTGCMHFNCKIYFQHLHGQFGLGEEKSMKFQISASPLNNYDGYKCYLLITAPFLKKQNEKRLNGYTAMSMVRS